LIKERIPNTLYLVLFLGTHCTREGMVYTTKIMTSCVGLVK
jgi:hypothetical protein